MPRGGPRPGAGAKPGNLNALKHGRGSAQLMALAAYVAQHPHLRHTFIRYHRRLRRQQRQAELGAAHLLQQFLRLALLANDHTIRDFLNLDLPRNARKNAKPSNPQSSSPKRSKIPI